MRGLGLIDDAPDVRGSHSLAELLGASVSGDACIDRTPLHVDDLEEYAASACPEQCARLSTLGCPEARPTAGGIPCEESCSLLLVRGIWTPDDVARVSAAETVARVRLCRVRCRR